MPLCPALGSAFWGTAHCLGAALMPALRPTSPTTTQPPLPSGASSATAPSPAPRVTSTSSRTTSPKSRASRARPAASSWVRPAGLQQGLEVAAAGAGPGGRCHCRVALRAPVPPAWPSPSPAAADEPGGPCAHPWQNHRSQTQCGRETASVVVSKLVLKPRIYVHDHLVVCVGNLLC